MSMEEPLATLVWVLVSVYLVVGLIFGATVAKLEAMRGDPLPRSEVYWFILFCTGCWGIFVIGMCFSGVTDWLTSSSDAKRSGS
jgi:hypothetical protein